MRLCGVYLGLNCNSDYAPVPSDLLSAMLFCILADKSTHAIICFYVNGTVGNSHVLYNEEELSA